MKIKEGLEKEYERYVEINRDDYSNQVIMAGEAVGKILDEQKTCEEAEKGMNGLGLTGFMTGCVSQSIVHFHSRGEEFREFWNNRFGIKDSKGVVNPAIYTIKTK